MQDGDLHADLDAQTERINEGAQIPQVEPSLIENWWDARSQVPAEQRRHVMYGISVITGGNPDLEPNPEELVALIMRCTLLGLLIERGILDNYMSDESLKKRVFAAAASLPCDKNDLGEAFALTELCDSPPEAVETTKEKMRQAGYDPDHPNLGYKFIEWMRDSC